MSRRRPARPRRGAWVAAAVGLLAVAGIGWWAWDAGRPSGPPPPPPDPLEGAFPFAPAAGAARPVSGSPGEEALPPEERRRAARPLSDEAREWLALHGPLVREVAGALDVSPVALGGIVAAEKTLHVGRADDLGEEVFTAVFGSLRERDLERWVAGQEAEFRADPEGAARSAGLFKNPYLWTLGPAQVSFRVAIREEAALARRLGRPERSAKEVLEALVSTRGNLEYAAALLGEAEVAYRTLAGMDIADNPGLLATLYQLGAPTVRARRLATDNAARARRGEPPVPPQVSAYGAFVNRRAEEIARALEG